MTSLVCPLMHECSGLTGWDVTDWITYEGKRMHKHLIPCADLRQHQLDPTCWCQPVEDEEAEGFWIHNSADEREKFEVGDRRPS